MNTRAAQTPAPADYPDAHPETPHPDASAGSLYLNARIYTADAAFSQASVLAVRGGSIVYAGDDRREGAARLGPGAREVDLQGKTVLPGLADSHLHFLLQGQRLAEIDIHLKPKEEILRLVREEARRLGPGRWVVGRGWNHEIWADNRWPDRAELDAAAPHNPVALTRADAHSVWASSLALAEAGFDDSSPDMPGGEILRRPDGTLRGILVDTPIFRIWQAQPAPGPEQKLGYYRKAEAELFSLGVTSVGDAWQTLAEHENLKNIYASGGLKIRVHGMLGSQDPGDRARLLEAEGRDAVRPLSGLFGGRLSLRAYKAVLDGSLGSRSAWLSRDYADRPGHRGSGRYTDQELCELLRPALERGFQLCLHAIGDAAVEQAMRVFESLAAEGPPGFFRQGRHRIEHFQSAAPGLVARALALGLIPSMQPTHQASDVKMAELRLGPDLLRISYPWRQVLDAGGLIAAGSDSPMEEASPFLGLHSALARLPFSALSGSREAAEALRMSRREALLSYTLWAAYAAFSEQLTGSLEVGKAADFIVLDRDVMACPVPEIPGARVLLTVLDGREVYSAS
ncbi:amidohydrolase [Desulfovibrio sp. OttesenSCG-928-C14]|nr:amidohydrolase [Desulfovibrio sp. OttesenSCG-928-C14]